MIEAYGIDAGTHWLDELLATYVLYAYMARERAELVWLLDVLQGGDGLAPLPRYVSLVHLESRYTQILTQDGANYGWYQGQFLKQSRDLRDTGHRFLAPGCARRFHRTYDTPLPR